MPSSSSSPSKDLPNYNIDTFHYLRAISPGLFSYCAKENKNFFACKRDKGENPEACVTEAIDVRRCAFRLAEMYSNPENPCKSLFDKYLQCIHRERGEYSHCFDIRVPFETCASKRLGIEFRDPAPPVGSDVHIRRRSKKYGVVESDLLKN